MTEQTYSDALRRLESIVAELERGGMDLDCLLYTSPSPRDQRGSGIPACG